MMMMMMMMCCRKVPRTEIVEVARYLASLFSCDVESLPTDLLIHSYWTLMPNEFNFGSDYQRCLTQSFTQSFAHAAQNCHYFNPHYCGRRFGEQADFQRLTVCRQLLSGRNTPNYTVPQSIRVRTKRFLACLNSTRTAVMLQYLWTRSGPYFSAVLW